MVAGRAVYASARNVVAARYALAVDASLHGVAGHARAGIHDLCALRRASSTARTLVGRLVAAGIRLTPAAETDRKPRSIEVNQALRSGGIGCIGPAGVGA